MSNVVELCPGISETIMDRAVLPVAKVIDGVDPAAMLNICVVGRCLDGSLYVAGSDRCDVSIALLARAMTLLTSIEDKGLAAEPEETEPPSAG